MWPCLLRRRPGCRAAQSNREALPFSIQDFQLLSLRLICSAILHTSPFYKNMALEESRLRSKSGRFLAEESQSEDTERRPRDASLPESSSLAEEGVTERSDSMAERSVWKNTGRRLEELSGLYIPGETVALNLSCEHLPQAARLIYSKQNPGAYEFGKEIVRAIIGVTLVAEEVSGLRGASGFNDGAFRISTFQTGDRVEHIKHGLGMVTGYAANGRLAVSFDNGQSHNYKPASVALKILRAPADAPPPPASVLRRSSCYARESSEGDGPSTRESASERRSAVTDADRLAWAAPSRRRRFSRTSEGSGVERLLLYLNRDTWIGQDGDTLAEVVRVARYAAGHTSWHGSSDRAQLRR